MPSRSTNFAVAGRGFAWSFAASGLVLVASLVSQLILGWYLTSSDFGVYAIALACANLITVFRDGGIGRWLIAKSPEEFSRDVPKAHAVIVLSSWLIAAILALVAPLAGHVYHHDGVTRVMWILAAAVPVSAYAVVAGAQLQVEYRFAELAGIKVASALVRYGASVALAVAGWGPQSFAWPVLFCGLLEYVLYRWRAKLAVSARQWQWADAREILGESRWSVAGAFAASVMRQSDYAVLGLVATQATVGTYYFAFQLALQPVLLFTESLRKIVIPMFGRIAGDRARESRSLARAGILAGMLGAPPLLLLAVIARPLEQWIWNGRWEVAVVPMQLLACAMPFHFLALFAESAAISRGRFRLWTITVLTRGIGAGIAAWLAGIWSGPTQVNAITATMAWYLGVSAVIETAVMLRSLRLPSFALWRSFLPVYGSAT
ncbi:MAG TPA: oligosaccharide flippase family protein, partial [Pirellulaceae bacterium]